MLPTNLDMDVLRALVIAMENGGFARAAERLGRTQSAISLQMKKLEEQVGQPLFRKAGRTVALTDVGDLLLGYARRIVALNDEALSAARGRTMDAGTASSGTTAAGAHGASPSPAPACPACGRRSTGCTGP